MSAYNCYYMAAGIVKSSMLPAVAVADLMNDSGSYTAAAWCGSYSWSNWAAVNSGSGSVVTIAGDPSLSAMSIEE